MKTRQFPAPNGTPERIGQIQWMVTGVEVHENHSWPMGQRKEAKQMMQTEASGYTRPVAGSFLCELTIFRASGSVTIANMVPTPIPTNASPVNPADHPRRPV